ncbi:WD40 repeat-like protein [Clavulina sp. PMI_390]|nr:WD40 repeat-like protein [Clavulina sp. PMI_390]
MLRHTFVHPGSIQSTAFSVNGWLVAGGCGNGGIWLWDLRSGTQYGGPLKGHRSSVQSVAFSPDGNLLASGSWNDTICLWDVHSQALKGEPLKGHTSSVYSSVAFSPDGQMLASSSSDCTVRIWNLTTLTSVITIPPYHHYPISIDPTWGGMFEDGWIRSTADELILWVPASYRANLYDERLITIFGQDMSSRVRLNFDQMALGEDWTKCYSLPSS